MRVEWSNWLNAFKMLLAPAHPVCLFCGKAHAPSAQIPGICLACESAIPWIKAPRCRTCGRPVGCPDCSRSRQPGPLLYNRSAVSYTAEMREILGQYKYRGNERLAQVLGLMLDRAYTGLQEATEHSSEGRWSYTANQNAVLEADAGLIIGAASPHKTWSSLLPRKRTDRWQADLLVPVPVSGTRLAERGFNQAGQLAAVIAARRGIPQLPLLVRTQHTAKQSFKSRAERLYDMKHAFAADCDSALQGQFAALLRNSLDSGRPLRIVIVDDIYTTGSTLRACAEALIRQPGGSLEGKVEICSLTWARS